jgi:hypothetical protein
MDCRKNIYSLSPNELNDFREAVNLLKANGTYDTFIERHHHAMMHATPMPGEPNNPNFRNAAHRGPAFSPWHRQEVRDFELALQSVKPGVTLPYWDWAQDAALPDPTAAPLWTDAYIGGDGAGPNNRVPDGPFKDWVALIETSTGALVPRSTPGIVRMLGRDPQGFPTLPTQADVTNCLNEGVYDSAPWRTTSDPSFRNRLEGWLRRAGEPPEPRMHNRVHTWVGGDMQPGTSPNDPVFFLHHCNVDRLWAQWQADNPGLPYVPASGGPPEHNATDPMLYLARPGVTPNSTLDHHAMGYMYDTEPPVVTQETMVINFNDVPEGETTFRAARFRVNTCTSVTLEFVPGFGPNPPYSVTSLGSSVTVTPADGNPAMARLWVQFTGTTAGAPVPQGSVRVRCVETGQTWDITITANTIDRPTVATMLVLDQSGSMDAPAGTGALRIEVLREAATRFVELIQPNNGLGVVRFDHDAYPGIPVNQIGAGSGDPNRAAALTAVQNHNTNPMGLTSIGDGVELGQSTLAPVTGYMQKAMIVFTDGHENSDKRVSQVMGSVNDRVFAIGLGTAEQIQPNALNALVQGTGGFLLLTGHLTPSTSDYFRLTKYFLQILAGVTNQNIVVDPDGWIPPGQRFAIPFDLNEADIGSTIVLLTDLPAVDLTLETPDGDIIDPAVAAGNPAMSFSLGTNMSWYQLTLPVPIGPNAAHAGTWQAILEVDERDLRRALGKLDNYPEIVRRAQAHGVQYSLAVHAYSNLRMEARLAHSSLQPGATLTLRAVLSEYGVPVAGRAEVRVELQRPDNTTATLTLAEVEEGIFEGATTAAMSGVYRFRVVASGRTFRGIAFQREQALTGAVWHGGDGPLPTGDGNRDERLCHLFECLLSDESIGRYLAERGIEVEVVRKCLTWYCEDRPREREGISAAGEVGASRSILGDIMARRDVLDALTALVETIRLKT